MGCPICVWDKKKQHVESVSFTLYIQQAFVCTRHQIINFFQNFVKSCQWLFLGLLLAPWLVETSVSSSLRYTRQMFALICKLGKRFPDKSGASQKPSTIIPLQNSINNIITTMSSDAYEQLIHLYFSHPARHVHTTQFHIVILKVHSQPFSERSPSFSPENA